MGESTEFILGSSVSCSDGPCGELTRLVVDPAPRAVTHGHRVTHILLDEGHLWGKRTVAIPISAVADFSDGIRLSLAQDEVRDLPPARAAPGAE